MLRYVLRALLDRPRESAVLFLLAGLTAGIVASAPWYLVGRAQLVATADLAAAPPQSSVVTAERLVTGSESYPDAVASADADVAKALPMPGTRRVDGMQVNGLVKLPARQSDPASNTQLIFRTGVCEQLVVEGSCPRVPGDVVISAELAADLGLAPGAQLLFTASSNRPLAPLTVTGVARIRDPQDRFWAGRFRDPLERGRLLFVASPATFTDLGVQGPRVTVDVVPEPQLFAEHEVSEILAVFRAATLRGGQLEYKAPLWDLAADIGNQQIDLATAIIVITAEVLVFGWLVLFLVLRQLGWQHRVELGTLKLRGVAGSRTLLITVGRHAVSLIAGAIVGTGTGMLLARSGLDHIVPRYQTLATIGMAAAVGLVIVGALIAMIIAERRNLTADVTHLLRTALHRPRGPLLIGLEAGVVVAALAAIYLVHGGGQVLGPLVPMLMALAFGIVVAESVTAWLGRAGRRRLRRGNLPAAVAALWHARRPGLLRASALLTLAVAMAGIATATAATTSAAQSERAARALGADRILSVRAPSNAALLAAVRAADPTGQQAMAVVRNPSGHVLAVDSSRLASVATWPTGSGSATPASLATLLRPETGRPLPAITGDVLTATVARADTLPVRVWLGYELVDATGAAVRGRLGPIVAGPDQQALRGEQPSCAQPCRLRSLSLLADPGDGAATAPAGTRVRVASLSTEAPVDDRTAWRVPLAAGPARPVVVSASTDGLVIAIPAGEQQVSPFVYPYPGVAQVPVIAGAGWVPASAGAGFGVLPGVVAASRTVGSVDTVPGTEEPTAIVDLEVADRFGNGVVAAEGLEVWLAAGAPADLADGLRAAGLQIVSDQRASDLIDRLSQQASPVAARYQATVWWLAVLIGAVALLVLLIGEETELVAALTALRQQGFQRRQVRRAGIGAYAWVVGSAVGTGLIAAVVARPPLLPVRPVFDDAWQALSGGPPVTLAALAGALLVAGLSFTLVCAVAAGRLVRGVRG